MKKAVLVLLASCLVVCLVMGCSVKTGYFKDNVDMYTTANVHPEAVEAFEGFKAEDVSVEVEFLGLDGEDKVLVKVKDGAEVALPKGKVKIEGSLPDWSVIEVGEIVTIEIPRWLAWEKGIEI